MELRRRTRTAPPRTSAAAPVWAGHGAGLVTLLNDARLAANKTTLGFLPPMLYAFAKSTPAGFTDITRGDNKCTRESGSEGGEKARWLSETPCCKYGFDAGQGWDAVTGLGSPKFEALKACVLGLP